MTSSEVETAGPLARSVRWPAEWEAHEATWLSWPHNTDTWPGRLLQAEAAFVEIVRALLGAERVRINVLDLAMEDRVRSLLREHGVDPDPGVSFHTIPTDDAWARDHGPVFVRDPDGPLVALDFRFDAWGGKYTPFDRDAAAARRMAETVGVRCLTTDVVLEGGSIDGNGQGTVLTTESCLLQPNRGAGRSRESMEDLLASTLGTRQLLWLGGGIVGDDTDGHVDDVARFIEAGTVVAALEESPADPNHAPLAENLARLTGMRDQDGKPLDLVPLPMPPPVVVDGVRLPASYANFYLANGVALVPTFQVPEDDRALAVLREVLHEREVVGIPCRDLVVGLGAVHCVTQQQPAVRTVSQATSPDTTLSEETLTRR